MPDIKTFDDFYTTVDNYIKSICNEAKKDIQHNIRRYAKRSYQVLKGGYFTSDPTSTQDVAEKIHFQYDASSRLLLPMDI